MIKKVLLALSLALAAVSAHADEGMWLPSLIGSRIKDMRSKGFRLTAEDIYSVNKASMKDAVVLFGGGCTGEFVSAEGLLLTNHHCGYGSIQQLSSVERDYLSDGFWASSREDELPVPGLSVSILVRMEDVTERVAAGEKPADIDFYRCGYSVVPYIGELYACYALSFTGGATLKWFRDNFAELEFEKAEKENKNVYAELDKVVGDKPTGILVLPHFAGAATPYMDNDSKAAFVGITLETTKFDLYKALMEGTSYEMLLNFNTMKALTGEIKEIRATGGGATSDVWLQIKADILETEKKKDPDAQNTQKLMEWEISNRMLDDHQNPVLIKQLRRDEEGDHGHNQSDSAEFQEAAEADCRGQEKKRVFFARQKDRSQTADQIQHDLSPELRPARGCRMYSPVTELR